MLPVVFRMFAGFLGCRWTRDDVPSTQRLQTFNCARTHTRSHAQRGAFGGSHSGACTHTHRPSLQPRFPSFRCFSVGRFVSWSVQLAVCHQEQPLTSPKHVVVLARSMLDSASDHAPPPPPPPPHTHSLSRPLSLVFSTQLDVVHTRNSSHTVSRVA